MFIDSLPDNYSANDYSVIYDFVFDTSVDSVESHSADTVSQDSRAEEANQDSWSFEPAICG